MSADTLRAITPNTYARRLGVGIHKILRWIARGELRALNVASEASRKPQWAILPDAIADFERRREAQPPPQLQRKRRRNPPEMIEYF